MEFGWINGAGGTIVALMLLPNILYGIRCPGQENRCKSLLLNLLEQAGRYASMALMVFPLGVWKFGFSSVESMLLYFLGNAFLLLAYWGCWAVYFRKPGKVLSGVMVVIPTCIFLLSGAVLHHWLLVVSGVLFGIGHGYVTAANLE